MKKALFLIFSAVILLGCTEDPILTLKSGNSSIDLPSDGGSASVTISCNNAWSASSNASWIKISPSSGSAGDSNISISVSSNSDATERQGVVTVQSEGLTLNINVKQAQANTIILSQKEVNMSDEGGSFTVNVKSNVNYTVDITNGTGWLENISSKALTSKDYTFSVKKNEKYDDRTAVVTFKDASNGISESVTVHQAQKGAIILSQKSIQVSSDGGAFEVELKASLSYNIYIISGSDWVKRTDTKSLNTYKHSFLASANDTYDSREALVVFSSTTTNVSDTLSIRQAVRTGLIVTERQKYLDAAGGTFDVELQSNVEYNIVMPTGVAWLKRVDTKAMETYKHTFSVEENKTYDDRSANVIFRSKDGTLADTLFVTQRQVNALILTQNSYSLDDESHDITVKIKSNITYSVTIEEGVNWVTEVNTKALTEYTHTFHVSANPEHAVRQATVYFKSEIPQLTDSLVIEQGLSGVVNLSASETANCYIVEEEGVYCFNADIIGNGNKGIMQGYGFHTSDASINPKGVQLLWQDNEIVSNITLQNGRVFFNASSQKGNAVIAVTNKEGVILWSWHIWATDRPDEIRLSESTHAYLDRNLGATTVRLGLESSNGLFYQWGRKDPFNPNYLKRETIPSQLTINILIEHPTSFYISDNEDWVDNDKALWGNPDGSTSVATYKTIYDPCPIGYTIPSDAAWYEYGQRSIFEGHRYYSRIDPTIEFTYQTSGFIASKGGKEISYPATKGLSDSEEDNTYGSYFRNNNGSAMCVSDSDGEGAWFSVNYSVPKRRGSSIRCVKEESYMMFPPTVETDEAGSVKITDLILRGRVINNGNTPIKAVGFYWGLSQNDIGNRIECNYQGGFSHHLEGLPAHGAVYVRAFAENEIGRSYGDLKVVRLKTATEYAVTVLDSLSRFTRQQYLNTQGMNGEGTIRLWYGDLTGSSTSHNQTGWASLYNLDYLTKTDSKYSYFPLFYYYRIINKVNTTIDKYLPWADELDPNIDFYKASLLGYRAYAYTMLVQLYCKSWDASGNGSSSGLPLRISADDDVTTISSLADVYRQIYKDLDTAIDMMKHSSIDRSDVHDMDLRTLYAIYAKAALNKKDYSIAVDYAKLARSSHPLMSNSEYFQGFNEANNEWIWGAYYAGAEYTIYYYDFFAYIGYNSSSSACRTYPKCISKELFDRIPSTDIRRKLFLDPGSYSYSTTTGEAGNDLRNYGFSFAMTEGRPGLYSTSKVFAYMQLKFAATYMPGGGRMNYIRAAEMVLIEAEANYFLGNEAETRSLLNYLNKESGRDSNYNCTKSGTELLSELKFYRRLELWGEGFDWYDLKRWGDPVSRKSFADGGNFPSPLAGYWTAEDKNDFVWMLPDDYQNWVRTGSEK